MTWRVRDRATFAALARAPVVADEHVRVRRLAPQAGHEHHPAQVAYALDRRLGSAVARNRIRRRLRSAVRVVEPELEPGERLLVMAGRGAARAPFGDLCEQLGSVVRRARRTRP